MRIVWIRLVGLVLLLATVILDVVAIASMACGHSGAAMVAITVGVLPGLILTMFLDLLDGRRSA